LTIDRWAIIVGAGGSLFIIEELRKTLFPRLFSLGKWQPVENGWLRQLKNNNGKKQSHSKADKK
jgi:hypothetical protein